MAYQYKAATESRLLTTSHALEQRATELRATCNQEAATLAGIRAEIVEAKRRLRQIRESTRLARQKQDQAYVAAINPYPEIVFTEPPGTGAARMRIIHREIDALKAAS